MQFKIFTMLTREWDAVTSCEQIGIPGLKLIPSKHQQEAYWIGDGSPEWEDRAVAWANQDNQGNAEPEEHYW